MIRNKLSTTSCLLVFGVLFVGFVDPHLISGITKVDDFQLSTIAGEPFEKISVNMTFAKLKKIRPHITELTRVNYGDDIQAYYEYLEPQEPGPESLIYVFYKGLLVLIEVHLHFGRESFVESNIKNNVRELVQKLGRPVEVYYRSEKDGGHLIEPVLVWRGENKAVNFTFFTFHRLFYLPRDPSEDSRTMAGPSGPSGKRVPVGTLSIYLQNDRVDEIIRRGYVPQVPSNELKEYVEAITN